MHKKSTYRVLALFLAVGMLFSMLNIAMTPVTAQSGTEPNLEKVEAEVLDAISTKGEADFVIEMAEKADLSAAYAIKDWSERGWFVYNTLKETAARTQAPVIAVLKASGLKYESFYAGNEIAVTGSGMAVLSQIAALDAVGHIRYPRTATIDPIDPLTQNLFDFSIDALDWGIKGEMLGGLIVLSALGISSFIVSPWAGLVMTRLGLAFFGGAASGIGYAIPAMMFGTFDPRQFIVAVGVGAVFGAFPEFLGGAGWAAFFRGALANEIQYVVSAVVCDDIKSLTPVGHVANIVVGGVIGARTGPSLSPEFDSVWLKSVVPQVYENIGGRYANQFLWTAVEQVLQGSKQEFFRSSVWEIANNATVDKLSQVLETIIGWLTP
ncbi:MAG TPA: hypothetical protein PKH77_28755 [Anaerolineae bacterium]|nr:hypothetical protein [Anaerolineae bacterium]